jgi:hypothetical protein
LGIYSQTKTVQEIQDVEKKITPYQLQVSAFIFDRYSRQGSSVVKDIVNKLGTGERIYHITLSPELLTATQVASGYFDSEYRTFFEDVKKYNMKVIFRTMHEMNGGWYARWSDPTSFKRAWKRVYALSREVGLDKSQIQFDFSFNRHDMPLDRGKVKDDEGYVPNQSSPLITCDLAQKAKTNCLTREDYYPGHQYVDIIWFSVYNWGKATSNRQWLSFIDIIFDQERNNRSRILTKKKPIYIDEIGTTAVYYNQAFDWWKSQKTFALDKYDKSKWLHDLAEFVDNTPEIIGMSYFNVDYTHGLAQRIIGEADWKIIDPQKGILYDGVHELLKRNDSLDASLLFETTKAPIKTISTKNRTGTILSLPSKVKTPSAKTWSLTSVTKTWDVITGNVVIVRRMLSLK